MGALDDLLLSQQPAYSGDQFASLLPTAPASAPGPLESFDANAPGADAAAPSPFDFLPQDSRLNFAGPTPPTTQPTVEQGKAALGIAASIFNKGQPLEGNTPAAAATPVGSFPITQTFMSAPGEYGIDLATPVGTPIRAPWGGTISWEQKGKADWGNRIFVKGQNGWTFAVGHLTRFAVANGAQVQPGQIIGFSGGAITDPNSGHSTGPHIEPQLISPLGYYVNPLPWLQQLWKQGPTTTPYVRSTGTGLPPGVKPPPAKGDLAVPAPSALDPRAALVAAERPLPPPGQFRGRMTTVPATTAGPDLGELAGRIPGTIGTIADLPFQGIGGVLRGLRAPQDQGLQGPIGDVGRAIFGTKAKPAVTDPAVADFYQQNRGQFGVDPAKLPPTFAELSPAAQAQVRDAYWQQHLEETTNVNPLNILASANPTPEMFYSMGEGDRFGPYATATPEQRQQAIDEGNQAYLFATVMLGAGPETAAALVNSQAARAAVRARIAAGGAALQNKLADLAIQVKAPGAATLPVGERQLGLPGVGKETSALPAIAAPRFTPEAISHQLAAEKAGQLSIPVQAEAQAKAAQLGAPKLFDDLRMPPAPVVEGPFHGTSAKIGKLEPTSDRAQSQNLYGPGFYTTENLNVARSYANTKGKGTDHPVYQVQWKGENPPQLLDLDKPLALPVIHAITHDLPPQEMWHTRMGSNPATWTGMPGRVIYKETINALHDIILDDRPEEARWAMDEHMHDIVDRLQALGYDGFTHQGGNLVGKEPHRVNIFFKPVDDAGVPNLQLTEVPPGARPASPGMGFLGAGDLQAAYDALAPRIAPLVKAGAHGVFNLAKEFDQPGQGLRETAAAMRAGLWGGHVNYMHQALDELASTPPEGQQAVALRRVLSLSNTLDKLYERRAAGEDVEKEIEKQQTNLAVYSKAARDVVSGWSHELGPTFQAMVNAIWHPYTLKQDVLGGDAMPKDPVLAIRYQGGMRNAVLNLGSMVSTWMRKNLKTPQQWDDLGWEMEQGNRAANRQLETRAVGPGAPTQRIEPAPGGGLRQVPTGEFEGQRIIPPPIKALATLLRAAQDAMGVYLTEYRSGDFFSTMRDNFWSRKVIGWRDPKTGKAVYKADLARFRAGPGRGLQLSPDSPHFQPRTLQEGLDQLEAAGWIVLKNPAQNIPEYWNSIAQAVANKNILQILQTSFKANDGRPIAIAGPAGHRPPGAEGYHHILPNLNAWVHPDAWKMVESQFDVNRPGPKMEALHRFGEVYRELNMINPLVHTINQTSHQLFQSLVPLRLWIMGHQLAKDPGIVREASVYTYIRPRRAATEYSEAMRGVTHSGITNPFSQAYQQGAADQGWSLPGASAHVALDTTLLPIRAAVDAGHTFLFEFVIRNAQIASYALEKEKLLKMGMDPEQARLIAGIRADRLVGAINPMTKNSFERKWGSLIFFAYNWSKTHVMQALESTPALGRQVLGKEHPYLTPAARRMLEEEMTWSAFRGITSALFYSNAFNVVLSGHPMWENEAGRELDWDYTQFARDHLGYTGTQKLYIDAMPMRWLNFFFQPLQAYRRQGEDSVGAGANALADWGQTKLMPPLSAILAWKSDQDPNKTAAFIRALETSIPLQRQMTALTGDSVLGPQTLGDLQQGVADVQAGWQPGGMMSPQAQRLLLNLSAFGMGENPVKKGPVQTIPAEQQKGYAAASFDRKVALELATTDHVGWPTAGELAKEKARRAVMSRPDGGEAVAQQQEDAFKAMQTQAIAEMAKEHNDANLDQVDLSPAAQAKMLANNQNPMDLLDNFEKAELFKKYPALSLYHQAPDLSPDERVRAVKNQTAQYHVRVAEQLQVAKAEQEKADAQLRQGAISFQTWRDQRTQLMRTLYDKNVGSVTSLQRELPDALVTKDAYDQFQKANGAPIGTATQRDVAYNAYKAISLDDPRFTMPDGTQDALAWKAERDRALSQLPKAEQDYVKLKESASWTDTEFLYHQLANRYLAFEQEHADAVHLYHQMFQTTNTVQARRAFEVQHPAIYQYVVARNTFMRQNPLVAEAFAHGSILFKALATHGVSPRVSPSQQIAQLLRTSQPGLDLNRPNGGTTQAQLQQEFAQGYGVPPDQQVPGPSGPSVDLTSLLASLQQPAAFTPRSPAQTNLGASLYR